MKRAIPAGLIQTFGLFDRRVDGDESLLELARLRFQQAGLNAEMQAASVEALEWTLQFRPMPDAPVMVHLPREWNLSNPENRLRIVELAGRFARRVRGFVLHDHPDLAEHPEAYESAARELDLRLKGIEHCPWVFIEYAAGLEFEAFARFFESILDLTRLSACIDVGHVGTQQARLAFEGTHPGQDVCALKSRPPELFGFMDDVSAAVESALPQLLKLIEQLGALHKPLHFHLHDGHPLSTFSPFGISDHLSFLSSIPLPFEYRGRRSVSPMYGPEGLEQIASAVVEHCGNRPLSLTLEIHPTFEQSPLGDAAGLFGHWVDKTNAEKMNQWLGVLAANQALLQKALKDG